jgi:hypothetical protein
MRFQNSKLNRTSLDTITRKNNKTSFSLCILLNKAIFECYYFNMYPAQQVPSVSIFDSLKQVTPLSKYLAMILFIAMPFIGGWIGYRYAPVKIVEVETVATTVESASAKESTFLNTVSLCGKEFQTNSVYIDGVNLIEKLDSLLRSPLQSDSTDDHVSSCEEFLQNVIDMKSLKVTVKKVNYDYSPLAAVSNQFDAYAVSLFPNQKESAIDVGFLIDKSSYDVFRTAVLDGSRGPKVGVLQ